VVVSRDSRPLLAMTGVGGVGVEYVDTEVDLLYALTALVVRYVNTRTYTHTLRRLVMPRSHCPARLGNTV